MKGADVNWRGSLGWTALHCASCGRPHISKVLLKSSPNINQQSNTGNTPLHLVCKYGSLPCVKLLLATGQCDTGIVNDHRRTALEEAAHDGKQDVVKYLHSVDVNKPGLKKRVLKQAVLEGDVSFVKYLVTEQGVDVNEPDLVTRVLELTICEGDVDFIKYLVTEQGVGVNEPDLVTRVLELTICEGDVDFIKYLVTEQGVDVNGTINKAGQTPLSLASALGHLDIVKYLVETHHCDPRSTRDKAGQTPLSLAYSNRHLDTAKYLVQEQQCDPNFIVNKEEDTPLSLECAHGNLDWVKALISDYADPNGTVNKAGQTPLSLASACGHLDIVKYLAETHHCDPRRTRDKAGQTPLSLAYSNRHLETVKYLVQSQQCDPNFVVNQEGDTPFSIECSGGNLVWVEALISKHVDPKFNEQHLLLACEHQQAAIVEYLLTAHHINPNAKDDLQRTPLSLAKNKDVIKILIQHGADAKNVYALHREVLNSYFSEYPLESPVKMFVIGHGGEGKSTLIEAMEHEPTFWTSVVNVFIAPREVEGVDQRTAGIIPRVFKSRFFGGVQFFDFAGQEAYYSSHAAVIKSAVDTCPPVFLLVIGLQNDDTKISYSISYWLGIITNQCTSMEDKAPLIVVCSHADYVDKVTEIERKKDKISISVRKFPKFDLIDIVAMDCRYSNSKGMNLLRRHVESSCDSIRTKLSVSLNSHMFLIYLVDNYSNELALTLERVKDNLEAKTNSASKKDGKVLPFIPTTIPRLIEICVQLSDKGHILFLENETSPEKSFIIIDKTALLAKINGTMFAPKDFKQHCQLATSTGVVPQSELAKHFYEFDINMLIRFLSHLELAVPIEDTEVLSLISEHVAKKHSQLATPSDYGFLFCPALIRLEVPPEVFPIRIAFLYRFGWLLSCMSADDFFDARFLHVLLLRLALSLGLAPVVDPDIPALQHQCSVWKTGVHWNTPQGAEVLVELVNKKSVFVLVQDHKLSFKLLQLQSRIIQKVLETAKQFCPSIKPEELLLLPSDVRYPLTNAQLISLFSVKSLAESVVEQEPFVVSTNGTDQLPVSDHEVYANLGENILQPLFNKNDPVHKKRISDRFLSAVSSAWSKNPQLVDIICSAISSEAVTTPKTVASVENLKSALKSWRDGRDGTYKLLRRILDPISVFAGKNPLELAGVLYRDFDESLLPDIETNSHHSNTDEVGGSVPKDSDEDVHTVPLPVVSEPSKSDLSIEELTMKYNITDEQLNTEIGEENIYDLAGCFDCVDTYLDKLGLTAGQQTQVEELAERRDVQTAMTKALKFWRQPNPLLATYRTLLQIFLDLKRGDVAVRVCQYIKQEVPKHKRQ